MIVTYCHPQTLWQSGERACLGIVDGYSGRWLWKPLGVLPCFKMRHLLDIGFKLSAFMLTPTTTQHVNFKLELWCIAGRMPEFVRLVLYFQLYWRPWCLRWQLLCCEFWNLDSRIEHAYFLLQIKGRGTLYETFYTWMIPVECLYTTSWGAQGGRNWNCNNEGAIRAPTRPEGKRGYGCTSL